MNRTVLVISVCVVSLLLLASYAWPDDPTSQPSRPAPLFQQQIVVPLVPQEWVDYVNAMPGGYTQGDFDFDGDVDPDDMKWFRLCFTGPDLPYRRVSYDGTRTPPVAYELQCFFADFDGDQDVDQTDFAALQRVLGTASSQPGE